MCAHLQLTDVLYYLSLLAVAAESPRSATSLITAGEVSRHFLLEGEGFPTFHPVSVFLRSLDLNQLSAEFKGEKGKQ